MKPKEELLRIVRVRTETETAVEVDVSGKKSGRGAYMCVNAQCLKRIRKSGAVSRQLGVSVPVGVWDQIEILVQTAEGRLEIIDG